MFARKGFVSNLGRMAMVAGVAATVVTSVAPSMAFAAPAAKEKGVTVGTSGATDFSARRRYYRGGGGAAAAAAFAGIVGTGLAIAAANSRRDYYYQPYGYYDAPGYYAAPTYYYGGGPYYYGGRGVPYYRGHPLASW
jgi:hypothetical protein